jgi:large subunit ribosomal protein L32
MAVPKKKTSTSKRNQRRSHDGLTRINYGVNKTTGELQLPHQVSVDGYYKGKKVIKEKVKKVAEGEVVPEVSPLEKSAPKQIENKEATKKTATKKTATKKTAPKEPVAKSKAENNKKDSDKSDPKKL